MPRAFIAPLLLALLVAGGALAHGFKAGSISIGHPFAHATPPGATRGAAYLKLTNAGRTEDALLSATGDIAEKIEIHLTTLEDGIVKMRPVPDGVAIPAGGTVKLEQGGYHLMLIGLKQPLQEGQRVPIELTFRQAGKARIELAIEAAAHSADDPHAGH